MRVDLDHFEQMYSAAEDPWNFAEDHVEQRKYAITVASLPLARYRRCYEPGCSIGALTERLAAIADVVIAQEASPTAAERAAKRLATHTNVEVRGGSIPEMWPNGTFDLIVFSELGYYWDTDELRSIAVRLTQSIETGGHLVAVHWLGQSDDHLLSGREVHDVLRSAFGRSIVHHEDETFVLEVWTSR